MPEENSLTQRITTYLTSLSTARSKLLLVRLRNGKVIIQTIPSREGEGINTNTNL